MSFESVCFLSEKGLLKIATCNGSYVFPLQFVSSIKSKVDGNVAYLKVKTEMTNKTFFTKCKHEEIRQIIDAWKIALDERTADHGNETDETVCFELCV